MNGHGKLNPDAPPVLAGIDGLHGSCPECVDEVTDLLRKVQSAAESTKNWRAEVVERSEIAGGGINLKSEVRTRIAVEAPLKMRRQNSGEDQTVFVSSVEVGEIKPLDVLLNDLFTPPSPPPISPIPTPPDPPPARHLIILGQPGAGKTTSMKHLCHRLLNEDAFLQDYMYLDRLDRRITAEFFDAKSKQWRYQLREVEMRMKQLETTALRTATEAVEFMRSLSDACSTFGDQASQQQRALASAMLEKATWRAGKFEMALKEPYQILAHSNSVSQSKEREKPGSGQEIENWLPGIDAIRTLDELPWPKSKAGDPAARTASGEE